MVLGFASTELLLTKDYTPYSRQRREHVLRRFIIWAEAQGITTAEAITTGSVRRTIAYLREQPDQR